MFNQWLNLLFKELRFHFHSLTGVIFILLFLIVCGCMLWIVPGVYNIIENGYATFDSFFSIAPVLFLFLIPALAMRVLSEEKKMHTLLLLRSRPISINAIITSKIVALFIVVTLTLIPTLIYVVFIYHYGNPIGNIDLGSVFASYIGLFFLIYTFICISVFASSLTSNQVVSLIIGMLICNFFYYGFDLLSLSGLGFQQHYKSIRRGLIIISDLFYFLTISGIFVFFTLLFTGEKIKSKTSIITGFLPIIFLSLNLIINISWDVTKDKRYSLNPLSKKIVKKLESPVNIDIYLSGNLNPGFRRLQQSVLDILADLNKSSFYPINYNIVDPYKIGREFMDSLATAGIKGISVNERLSNGRVSQQILYPYAQAYYQDKNIIIPLLVNQFGKSGEENLNLSRELFEYQLIHTIELLTQKKEKRIAFLEGHGELPEESISEILDALSQEYTIDKGSLSGNPKELDEYDLVVIAGPTEPFTEIDKLVLDQYIMKGGSLLCFINGVQLYSLPELIEKGKTMSKANELNLNDLFFSYGLKINPVLLQDIQCLNIPVPTINEAGETEYIPKPWYYAPLLNPNPQMEITKDLSFVKSTFGSTITLVGENPENNKTILLKSSQNARTIPVPSVVSMEETQRNPDPHYFKESNLPVAILVEPPFESVFKNRNHLFSKNGFSFKEKSDSGKIILVASDEIITNPLGYDLYSHTQFSNQEFVLNAVNYLTDSEGIFGLKKKALPLLLLNKKKLHDNKNKLIIYNVVLPPLLVLIVFISLTLYRKRKYERKAES